jgi:hypothetical protein
MEEGDEGGVGECPGSGARLSLALELIAAGLRELEEIGGGFA